QGVQVIGPVGHRVPILKLQLNGLDCDLSCGNLLPLLNTQLLRLYAELMPQMAVLCISVKRWAKTQGIGSVMTGGLSSYAWTLMVVYYLQVTHSLDSLHQLCEEEASLLFYAEDFGWQNELVSVRRGCFSVREESIVTWRDGLINIEDPVEITRNLNFALSDRTPHQLPDAFWAAGERLDRGGLEALLELPVPAAGGRFSLPFRRLPFHLRPATLRKLRAQLEAEATEVTRKAATKRAAEGRGGKRMRQGVVGASSRASQLAPRAVPRAAAPRFSRQEFLKSKKNDEGREAMGPQKKVMRNELGEEVVTSNEDQMAQGFRDSTLKGLGFASHRDAKLENIKAQTLGTDSELKGLKELPKAPVKGEVMKMEVKTEVKEEPKVPTDAVAKEEAGSQGDFGGIHVEY
ncbi:unnamed protein product, partial [Effrenium voratum]